MKSQCSTSSHQDLLEDVTVTIPVRIDSRDRARNLRLVTSYLLGQFNCSLVIAEEGESAPSLLEAWKGRFEHVICPPRPDAMFWKTRLLNVATQRASTPLILSYDADVIVPATQLRTAAGWLREGDADMVYPFDGTCIDIPKSISRGLEDGQGWDSLSPSSGVARAHVVREGVIACVGGALLMNREKFVACGMENERFAGWGAEDDERYWRLTKLGMKVFRTDGPIYHLHHRVGEVSPLLQEQYHSNLLECSRIVAMDREQLAAEVRLGLPLGA